MLQFLRFVCHPKIQYRKFYDMLIGKHLTFLWILSTLQNTDRFMKNVFLMKSKGELKKLIDFQKW